MNVNIVVNAHYLFLFNTNVLWWRECEYEVWNDIYLVFFPVLYFQTQNDDGVRENESKVADTSKKKTAVHLRFLIILLLLRWTAIYLPSSAISLHWTIWFLWLCVIFLPFEPERCVLSLSLSTGYFSIIFLIGHWPCSFQAFPAQTNILFFFRSLSLKRIPGSREKNNLQSVALRT